jgi:serine/threonine protein kinase
MIATLFTATSSPANLMLTPDDTVKVTDFGTAKILQFGTVNQTAHVMGTPSYMSPEQVKGKVVDGRSDIFSLGVLLYEMVTGEKPFPGQNITTVIYKIVNEEPVSPRPARSFYPSRPQRHYSESASQGAFAALSALPRPGGRSAQLPVPFRCRKSRRDSAAGHRFAAYPRGNSNSGFASRRSLAFVKRSRRQSFTNSSGAPHGHAAKRLRPSRKRKTHCLPFLPPSFCWA